MRMPQLESLQLTPSRASEPANCKKFENLLADLDIRIKDVATPTVSTKPSSWTMDWVRFFLSSRTDLLHACWSQKSVDNSEMKSYQTFKIQLAKLGISAIIVANGQRLGHDQNLFDVGIHSLRKEDPFISGQVVTRLWSLAVCFLSCLSKNGGKLTCSQGRTDLVVLLDHADDRTPILPQFVKYSIQVKPATHLDSANVKQFVNSSE